GNARRAGGLLAAGAEWGRSFARARAQLRRAPFPGAHREKAPPVAAPFAEDRDLVDDPDPVRWRRRVAVELELRALQADDLRDPAARGEEELEQRPRAESVVGRSGDSLAEALEIYTHLVRVAA